MPLGNKLKEIYTTLKGGGADVGSEEEFGRYFLASGAEGYKNRLNVYNTFKGGGADVGKDYNEFAAYLGLHAVKKPSAASSVALTGVNKGVSQQKGTKAISQSQSPAPKPVKRNDWRNKMQLNDFMSSINNTVDNVKENTSKRFKYNNERIKHPFGRSTSVGEKTPSVIGRNKNVVRLDGSTINPQTGEFEPIYMNEAGSEGNLSTINFEQQQIDDYKERQLHPVETELQDAYAERDRLNEELGKRRDALSGERSGFFDMPRGGMGMSTLNSISNNGLQHDEQYKQWQAASSANRDRIRTLETERDNKNAGFWRGFSDATKDPNTWLFGIPGIMNTATLYASAKTLGDGKRNQKDMTEAEKSMLQNTVLSNEAHQKYDGNRSTLYGFGQISAQALPFVAEFITTGGFKALSDVGAKYGLKAATKYATNNAAKWMIKNTGVAVGDIAAGWTMANTTGLAKTGADVMHRNMGDVTINDNGEYKFKGGKSFGKSLFEAEAAQTIEYYTEMLGNHFKIGERLAKGAEKMGLSKLSKAVNYIGTNKWLDKAGVQDLPSEGLEEEANIILNSMLVGDQKFSDLWDGKTQTDIWGGLAFSIGLMNVPKFAHTGYKSAQYYRYKHKTDNSASAASYRLTPEKWDPIKEQIDGATNETISDVINENVLTNNKLHPQEKKAVLDYANNMLTMRGYNMGLMNNAKEEVKDGKTDDNQDADKNYQEGYELNDDQARNDAKILYEQKREELVAAGISEEDIDKLDLDPISAASQVQSWHWNVGRQLALEYINSKMKYDGMIHRVKDDIDSRVTESNNVIDSRVNPKENNGDGLIHPATMKIDSRKVYIVGGNIVMNDDGTIVDHDNSDESVIVRDAETGAIEFTSPASILNIDETIDPEIEKEEAAERIRQEYGKAEADKIDGVLHFNDGDTYNILTDEGEVQQVIVSNNVQTQGQSAPEYGEGKIAVSNDGGKYWSFLPKDDVQRMSDAYNVQRLKQEQHNGQEEQHNKNKTFNVNDDVVLNTPEGTVNGTIINGLDDNGVITVQTDTPVNGKLVNTFTEHELNQLTTEPENVTENVNAVTDGKKQLPSNNIDIGTKFTDDEGVEWIITGNYDEDGYWMAVNYDEDGIPSISTLFPNDEINKYLNGERSEDIANDEKVVEVGEENAQTENNNDMEAALEPMPLNGNGEDAEPDYYKTTPQRTHSYLRDESGLEASDAQEFVNNMIDVVDKERTKLVNRKPKMGTSIAKYKKDMAAWQASIEDAQRKADFWAQVKVEQDKDIIAVRDANKAKQEAGLNAAAEAEAKRQAEVEAKKQEQEKLGANVVAEPIRQRWASAKKIDGAVNEIVLPNGEKVKGHYVLTESGAATPSHNSNNGFAKTEGFPVDVNGNSVNDRDYERDKDAQAVTRGIADNYDSRAVQTPVVVSNDGVVLSGNGRTMAGEMAAQNNTDGAYNDYVREHPEQYGFSSDQVLSMQHPRVLFVADDTMPYTADTFAKFNQQEMKGQSKAEQSVKLGKVVDNRTYNHIIRAISLFDTLSDFYADKTASTQAIKELIKAGVITEAQVSEMFDGDSLSARGKELLENVLIGKAFENNPDALREVTAYKSMRQSIITALSEISNNKQLGEDYSLEQELADAIDLVFKARNAGYKFGERASAFARQGNLFSFDDGVTAADYSNVTVMLLADVLNDTRVTLLKKYIVTYNARAKESADGQADLFTGAVESKEDIIKLVNNLFSNGNEEEQQRAVERAVEQRKEHSQKQDDAGSNVDARLEGGRNLSETEERYSKKSEELGEEERRKSVHLTNDEAVTLVSRMEREAEIAQEVELTAETWLQTFDDNNSIDTPLGRVKMGDNQIAKFFIKERTKEFGMVGPTLNNPDVIIRESSESKDGDSERASSYLFVKTFNRNGDKIKFYASITVKKDSMEVSVSSHYVNKNKVVSTIKENGVIYVREALSSNSSEMRLTEHQNDVPDLLPTQVDNTYSVGKDTNNSQNNSELEEKNVTGKKKNKENVAAKSKKKTAPKSKFVAEEDQDEFAALKARLKNKMHQLNSGIDPELLEIGAKMTYLIVKNGTRKFTSYAKAMIEEVGDDIRPWLKQFYSATLVDERLTDDMLDEMDDTKTVRGIDIANFDKTSVNALATAETVAKEQVIEKTADKVEAQVVDGKELVAATDEDIEGNPVVYKDGKRHRILMVVRKGEQLSAIGFSKSTIERVVLEDGSEAQISDLMIEKKESSKVEKTTGEAIKQAEAETNTYPTEAQKEAGNYKKGHVQIGTFDVTIENPVGSIRSGVDANGKSWSITMNNTYGYIRGTEGVDGDHIDVFIADDFDAWDGRKIFVVDQYNEDGTFDEHKVMLGFNDIDEAESAYYANYSPDWKEKHPKNKVTSVNAEDFEKWIDSSKRKTKAFADYSNVKTDHIPDATKMVDKKDVVVSKTETTTSSKKNEEEPKSIGKGSFGNIYDQFKGKAKEAIAFLMNKKDGEAIAALHHNEIGDIDLVWGKEGTAKSDGFGLAKLVKFHPEVLDNLQGILDDMHVTQRSENGVQLESYKYQAAIRLTWDNEKKTWLLTMFEKKNSVLDNTTDTIETQKGNGNDTATPENAVFSDGKDTKLSDKEEIKSKKNAGFSIDKRFHKKNGTYIYAVNFTERKDRDTFMDLKKKVKEFGGYYSSFGKGGFIFDSEQEAKAFADSVTHKNTDVKKAIVDNTRGFKVGDKVMYKGEEAIITDFESDGRPILDTGNAPVLYEVAELEGIEPMKVSETKKETKQSVSNKKEVSSQKTPGDLFGGLYDDENINNENKEEDGQTSKEPRVENRNSSNSLHEGESDRSGSTDNLGLDGNLQDGRNDGQGDSRQGSTETESVQRSTGRPSGRIQELEDRKNVNNNHAEHGIDYAPKSVDGRIDANIKAIELMQQLVESGKKATPAQMKVLRKFSGWGGLGKAFSDPIFSSRLRSLLGDEAYEQANMSRNSAYYTPANVIDSLWNIIKTLGFKGGNILEGSAGIGNMLGLMPTDISERSNVHAVEIDGMSGNILSLLYPDAKVEIQGFEETKIENGSIDLAITNVPFVTGLRVNDTTGDKDLSKKFHDIHDFCIAKNVRKLREGGIGVFITSSGTLDNSRKLREWIVSEGNADVVGAFRLNNTTFGGTGATSDIIIIRKRVNGKVSPNAIDVSSISSERATDFNTGETRKVKGEEVSIVKNLAMDYNRYFIEHPEMMGGEMKFGFENGDTFRPTSKALYPVKGKNQEQLLSDFVSSFNSMKKEEEFTSNNVLQDNAIYEELGNDIKEGSMLVDKRGIICIAQYGKSVPLAVNANKVKGHTKVDCFESYSNIKTALQDVLDFQKNNDTDDGLQVLLDKLNKAYDDFVNTYGHFTKNTSISFLKNDVDYSNIYALETYKETEDVPGHKVQHFGKTDIFAKRVVEKEKEQIFDNVSDGIISSIYNYGRIDVPYISNHLGKSEEEIKEAIIDSGLGFENPSSRQIEVSYEYLSGNVREKLQQAKDNNDGGKYDKNIKALERVIPDNIPAHLIEFTLGSSWIDPQVYSDFLKDKTGIIGRFTNVGGTWSVKVSDYGLYTESNKSTGVRSEKFDSITFGHELIEAAIQNKSIRVARSHKLSDGTTETEVDKEATQACSDKIDEFRREFKDWARNKMQSDPELSEKMERIYNEQFNNYVPRSIPNEFIPEHFGGQVSTMKGKPFSMRVHQSKAVIRGTMQPLLLAHEVGTGKTYTLIATAMEMRRLGTARKPMIVVQNATVGQFVGSAKELYPSAKVLTLEDGDRTAEGRKNFYAKIKYNDWDMIVVPQSVFERIPDSEERQINFIKDKVEEKLLVIEQMKEDDPDGKSFITRQAMREVEDLNAQMAEMAETVSAKRKDKDEKKRAVTKQNAMVKAQEMLDREVDDVENFDDMGIDAILVDEAHEYKHLGFATAMQRGVKGVDPSYSKKAQGVFLKTQSVLEKNNGRNVIFATGTPISNTAAEIWTFMRYLLPKEQLQNYGIYYFDDFVRNFGSLQQMLEFSTNGKFKENNRFAGYVNLPELVRIWSGVADTVRTKDAEGVSDKIPETEMGKDKAQDIYLPQTKALRGVMIYVKSELQRFEEMTGKEKKENSAIPLTMYNIAKAAAVDTRLVVDDAEDDPNSKTNEAVRQTLRSLEETKTYSGTIAIFADNYQNKHSGFNLYEDIRKKLIEQGVPADKIVVMKSNMSIKKKLEIFDKVNSGEVRVVMGSTFTLGTGVNIQERLHTLIHVDAPNRPMDYTQRNGRILRQGNLHKQWGSPVRVLRFGVEDSLDVTAYQRLKTKGAIADSIMNGKEMMQNSMENRALEEEEDVFGDTVAQLSGSEYAMLKNQAEKDARKYESKLKQYEADQTYIHNQKPRLQGLIKTSEQNIAENENNLQAVEHVTDKKITVNGRSYANVDAMSDYIKDFNKKLKETEDAIRNNVMDQEQQRKLPLTIGGIDFVVKTRMSREYERKGGALHTVAKRVMTYDCSSLGLRDVPVKQMLLRNALEDIVNNVVTGNDFKERIESAKNNIERCKNDLKQISEREGKPFQFTEELKKAHERVEEYSELMKKEMVEKEAKYAAMDSETNVAEGVSVSEEDSEDSENGVRFRDGEVTISQHEPTEEELSEIAKLKAEHRYFVTEYIKYHNTAPLSVLRNEEDVDALPWDAESFGEGLSKEEKADFKAALKAATGEAIAMFSPNTERIYIFANHFHSPELVLTHENVHHQISLMFDNVYNNDSVNDIWEAYNEDWSGLRDDLKKNRHCDNENLKNEFATEFIAINCVDGTLDDIEGVKPETLYNINVIAKKLNYDRRRAKRSNRESKGTVQGKSRVVRNIQQEAHGVYEKGDVKKTARELGQKLGVNVTVVTDVNEIEDNNSDRLERKRRSKGWYNPTTGEIVIVAQNNENASDAAATILHEIVGHKGLRAVVGDKAFKSFIWNVYNHSTPEVRKSINKLAAKKGWDIEEATEEYMAKLAESGFEDRENAGTWEKIKQFFKDMLSSLKLNVGFGINDNDIRYMLWRSYQMQSNKGIMGEAENVVMKEKLGVGEFANNDIRFRDSDDEKSLAQLIYDKATTSTFAHKFSEAWYDYLRSVKALQESLSKELGRKINDFENVYLSALHKSSVDSKEIESMQKELVMPLVDAVSNITNGDFEVNGEKVTQEVVEKYLNSKHGLERNVAFAKRDADLKRDARIDNLDIQLSNDVISQDAYDDEMKDVDKAWQNDYGRNRERDYSGLTAIFDPNDEGKSIQELEALAGDFVSDFEDEVGDVYVDELWNRIKAMNTFSLNKAKESGNISQDMYDKTVNMFDYYVPLRGFHEETSDEAYEYVTRDYNPLQKVEKKAKGRKSQAADILATMMNMGHSAIVQGNKNLVKQKLLNLALNADNKLLSVTNTWYDAATDELLHPDIDDYMTADKQRAEVERFDKEMRNRKSLGEVVSRRRGLDLGKHVKEKWQADEHCVRVMRNGKEYQVWVNGNPKAAQAINGVLNPDSGKHGTVVKLFSAVNRYLSKMVTSMNPEFLISNLQRDITSANAVTFAKHGVKYLADFNKNLYNNVSFLAVKGKKKGMRNGMYSLYQRYEAGTLDMSNERDQYFSEFIRNGGETGYSQLWTIDDYKKDIEKVLRKDTLRGKTETLFDAAGTMVEHANRGIENACRFAAYVTSRQHGGSVLESVDEAKEVSVNFNRKGSGAMGNEFAKAMFMFLNPAIQGLTQYLKLTKKYPAKMIPLMGGAMAMGVVMPMLASMLIGGGDGDDDDYWNLSTYARRNYLNIPIGDGKFLKWALSPEIRAMYGLGEIAYGMMAGNDKYENKSAAIMSQLSQLLPINPVDAEGIVRYDESMWYGVERGLTPSFFGYFMDAYVWNEDFAGRPITGHTKFDSGYEPEYTKAKKDTLKILVDLGKWIHEMTRGDKKYVKGTLERVIGHVLNPSALEYLGASSAGGMGQFMLKMWKTGCAMMGDEDYKSVKNYPMVSRVLSDSRDEYSKDRQINDAYKYYRLEKKVTDQEMKGIKNDVKLSAADKIVEIAKLASSDEGRRSYIIKNYQRMIDNAYDGAKGAKTDADRRTFELKVKKYKKDCTEELEAVGNPEAERAIKVKKEAVLNSSFDGIENEVISED